MHKELVELPELSGRQRDGASVYAATFEGWWLGARQSAWQQATTPAWSARWVCMLQVRGRVSILVLTAACLTAE